MGKKPINSQTEVQQDAKQQTPSFDFKKMNMEMGPLAYYALSSMREGNQIEVPIPCTVSGADMPAFLNFDDIYEFITFQDISVNCILVYLRRDEKLAFVSPTLISPVKTDTPDAGLKERADALVAFLRNAPKGRIYLVLHNRGRHWVLGVIDPWEDLVLYFDPFRDKKRDDFTNLMNMALMDWKLIAGEGIKKNETIKQKSRIVFVLSKKVVLNVVFLF
ncbi:hypothetical protein TIFTF001_022295 [Ficus carica]|uniref:Ubiquitin-like protease family profile domain-containing protein n=1 Tax=Ficus carica TaxID=3494 RepID=A0AA88AZG7_FICCA|nr:hypothetical protein TIFTF001_022295 [Ficus carica]